MTKPRAAQISVDPSGLAVVTGTDVQTAVEELDDAVSSVSSGSYTDPLTTKGDLVGRSSTATVRIPVGSNGQVLTADSTDANGVKWAAASGGYTDPLTTKGDLVVRSASATGRLPAGSNGQVLIADSTQTNGVKWGASSSVAESYEDVVTALTGKVHRWTFDEASGATVTDSINSLNLTLSGTYTRAVAGLFGSASATTFGASAKAVSSGLGSLPVGGNARCFIVLYKSTGAGAKQALISYGPTGSTRQWFTGVINDGQSNRLGTAVWADDLALDYVYTEGGWHLAAFGYDAMQNTLAYQDGYLGARRPSAAINTGSSGNFQIGLSTNNDGQFAGSIEDVLVLNNWPEKRALDRLYRTLSAL